MKNILKKLSKFKFCITAIVIIIFLYVFFWVASFGKYVMENINVKRNKENKIYLKIGQTKEKVLSLMGKPEGIWVAKDKQYEIIFFQDQPHRISLMAVSIGKSFPVIFQNNRVTGWDYPYYNEFVKQSNAFPEIKNIIKTYEKISNESLTTTK